MLNSELERRLRLLESTQLLITGAHCQRCGLADESGLSTTTFLNRHDGDRFVTLCKNSVLCTERREQRAAGAI